MVEQTQPEARSISEAMARGTDEITSYVSRGRIYEHLITEWLQQEWARVFRKWFASRHEVPASYQLVADIRAELALRDEQPPYDLVQAELQQARQHALENDPLGAQVMAQIMHERHTRGLSS